jgi:acetoin utilization deacetylase AcuC-like enzyme
MTPSLFFAERYFAEIGPHVFPMQKFGLLHQELLRSGAAVPGAFAEPGLVADADALRVHTPQYWGKVLHGMGPEDEALLEMPYTPELALGFRAMAQGSVLAAGAALEAGFAANLGGGFHHACPSHGEGFCMVHDVAIAIRSVQAAGRVERVAVVDTDVHQGNGTAVVFADDPTVYTFSIHQENNYPVPKPPSDLDIGLPDGVAGEAYLGPLRDAVRRILDDFRPQLVAYVAGVDPFEEDQLGGLRLTREDIAARDLVVLGAARERDIPVFGSLAGGYARDVMDTVRLHAGMVALGLSQYRDWPGAGRGN